MFNNFEIPESLLKLIESFYYCYVFQKNHIKSSKSSESFKSLKN